MNKQLTAILALLLTLQATTATAQTTGNTGVNIAQTFELRDVLNKRGKLTLGTEVASTLEFDTEVVEWAVGRDDLLLEPVKSKANPGLLYLRAKATQGSSSLDVMLQSGELARFTFTVNSKLGEGARYIVRSPRATPAAEEAQPPAAATTTTASGAANLPDWLRLEWRATVTANKDLYLNYILSNQSENAVIADAGKLGVFVTRGGKAVRLKYSLTRTTTGGNNFMMRGNSSQTGTVTVKASEIGDASAVLTQWTLGDNAAKISYLIEKKLSLEAAPQTFLRTQASRPERAGSPEARVQPWTQQLQGLFLAFRGFFGMA